MRRAHDALEAYLARFHGAEAALLFGAGYASSAAALAALPQPGDAVLFDERSHNSSRFGLQRSRAAEALAFRHNDVADAVDKLRAFRRRSPDGCVVVAVESVYSMDGGEPRLFIRLDGRPIDGTPRRASMEAFSTRAEDIPLRL